MKAWLKGGLIGLGILALLVILMVAMVTIFSCSIESGPDICAIPFFILIILMIPIIALGSFGFIIDLLVFFGVGAIIGLIVEKIKGKEK